MIIFLRFPDEETARAIMYEYLSDTGDWLTDSHSHTLDILGTICRPTGNMLVDETGMEYQELAPIAGFHVNFIGELPVGAEQYVVTPTNPVCIFAGNPLPQEGA